MFEDGAEGFLGGGGGGGGGRGPTESVLSVWSVLFQVTVLKAMGEEFVIGTKQDRGDTK